jgi:predicted enzyme related to lactoylglutathione lyase
MINSMASVWLPVQDMRRSVAFYSEALGLPVTEHDGDWSAVEVDGLTIGLNAKDYESPRGDGGAVIAFSADGSLEDEVKRLKGEGVTFTGEITEHPWGRIAPFADPDGNDLQLYAPPA